MRTASLTAAAVAVLGVGLIRPAPALAQAVIAPVAMPLPAVEAGPGWQPRSAGPVVIDAFRGGWLDAPAKPGNLVRPGRFAPPSGNAGETAN